MAEQKSPSSRCIAFSSFEFVSSTPALRPDKRRPGSLGIVRVIFRRDFPAWDYTLRRPMRWDFWQRWMKGSASQGRIWNFQVKGRYG